MGPGTFNDLNHHQVAALASCFIPGDRSEEKIQLRDELEKPLQQLQDSARRIAEVSWKTNMAFFIYKSEASITPTTFQIQHECKVEIDVDEYVVASVRPFLMDVIYCWSMVSKLHVFHVPPSTSIVDLSCWMMLTSFCKSNSVGS